MVVLSEEATISIDTVQYVLLWLLLFLPAVFICCCMPCCGITACICYRRKDNSQTRFDKGAFRVAARLFWFLKKKKDQDGISYFVILDKRAPIYYPYFLLFMTTVIIFYTGYSFVLNSVEIQYATTYYTYFYDYFINGTYYYDYYYDDYDEDSSICNANNNCVELDFIAGLEGAITVFSACIVTFAITTYSLLKCTSEHFHPLKRTIVIFFQIVGFATPRVLYYIYMFEIEENTIKGLVNVPTSYNDHEVLTGYLNFNSQIAFGAIFDSIALSMLTPWFLFVKDEPNKYRVDYTNGMTNNFIVGGISNI